MGNRDEQKENRRITILQTALELFIRKGYGETKIADIAQAANMSMGLLFHYYPSKEKLYEELILIGTQKTKMNFELADNSPLEILKANANDIFNMIKANPASAKMFVLMENANHSDTLSPEIKEMLSESDKLINNSITIIEKGQAIGEIRPGNPEALAIAFWNSIQGIAQHIALYPQAPCPDTNWIISIIKNPRNENNEN